MSQRRRAGAGVVVLVVLVVVAGLCALGLHLGDGYAARRVEREAGSQLQRELGTPTPPVVEVTGRPFLTQVVARHLRSVRVVADDVGTDGGSSVPVAHTDLVLSDVTTDDWYQTMTAARAEGTARLDYAALASVAGVPLEYVGDGRLQVRTTSSVFGVDVAATVTGTPQLDEADQTITLGDPDVRVGGVDLPDATAGALLRTVLKPIPVTGLPLDLTLTSVTPMDDGLHVGLTGEDVQLSR